MRRSRREILFQLAIAAMAGPLSAGRAVAFGDWPLAAPAEAGFAPGLGEQLDAGVAEGRFENLHAVLVVRHGRLVLERYYAGEDERWGRRRGRVEFGPQQLHDLRSVTKSVVGLLYGIALGEGGVPPPEAPLLAQFPEYPALAEDPLRNRMTVEHALSMKLGTEWDEEISYADPRNSEHAMELAEDRYRFALDRPMAAEPGSRWTYNGGATALLARLIEKGCGCSLAEFAEAKLFRPLGIRTFEWVRGADGAFIAASGLRLPPRDLARIGQLVLDGGRWDGAQLVPADWLKRSFETRAELDDLDYGYQWWLGKQSPGRRRWIGAFGNGGQRLWLSPGLDLMVVVLAGNYNSPDAWKLPVAIVTEVVLPSLAPR